MSFFQKIFLAFENFFKMLKKKADDVGPKPTPPKPSPPKNDDEEDGALVSDGSDLISDPDTIGTIVFPEDLEITEPVIDTPPVDLPDIPIIVPPTDDPTDSPDDPTSPPEEPEVQQRFLWCLDNGHGKFTKGKRSPKFEDGKRFFEYEFNRDIVKRIMEQLDEKGIKYFNVVPEVDTDNFLKGRVDRANGHQSDIPKLFVSIHANAARSESIDHWANPPAKGAETWYYTGSNRGRKLAAIFQKHMVNYTGMVNRGLKSTRSLYVIKNTTMTAVLTENGFYNHKKEAAELRKDAVRQLIADAHVAAILEVEKNGL